MAKRNIKVNLPVNKIEDLIKLANKVQQKHSGLDGESPLESLDMQTFSNNLTEVLKLRDETKELRKRSEALNEKANRLLGTDVGQTSTTPGTLYNLLTQVRDLLLVLNKGNEEALSEWGFDVVVS